MFFWHTNLYEINNKFSFGTSVVEKLTLLSAVIKFKYGGQCRHGEIQMFYQFNAHCD